MMRLRCLLSALESWKGTEEDVVNFFFNSRDRKGKRRKFVKLFLGLEREKSFWVWKIWAPATAWEAVGHCGEELLDVCLVG